MKDERKPGTWAPGQSGNPQGRPKDYRRVVELARRRTLRAIRTLTDIMEDPERNDGARVRAAETLLERGWGKAPQTIDVQITHDVSRLTTAQLDAKIAELEGMDVEH